jgi:hypothetical protein
MKIRFYLLLLVYLGLTIVVGVACEISTGGSEVSGEGVASGTVLFQDDFSNNNNNWDTWSGKGGSLVVLQDQTLRIAVEEPQYDYWSMVDKVYTDMRIDVSAAKIGGPDDNDFGIICRFVDKDNYYALLISSDGYTGILKVKQGEYTLLGSGVMEYNEAIRKGDAVNLLQADCVGNVLALTANGHKLLEVQDEDFKRGQIGVIAGTTNSPGTNIYFDNFVVYQP